MVGGVGEETPTAGGGDRIARGGGVVDDIAGADQQNRGSGIAAIDHAIGAKR